MDQASPPPPPPTPPPPPPNNPPPKDNTTMIVVISVVSALVFGGLIIAALVLVAFSSHDRGTRDRAASSAKHSTVSVDTPCYSFEGIPEYYIESGSKSKPENCSYETELWGERDEAGQPVITGVGTILGSISIEAVRTTTSVSWGSDLDQIMTYLNTNYFPPQGQVVTLKEPVTLDGVPAYKTTIKSTKVRTKTKDFVTVLKDPGYTLGSGSSAKVFEINVTTPEDNGEEIVSEIIRTWQWK